METAQRIRRDLLLPKLVLLGSSVLIALLAGEVLCAFVAPSTFVTTDILGRRIRNRPHPLNQPVSQDGHTYWDLIPNSGGRERLFDDYDYTWEINSLGLRHRELPPDRGSGRRILVLGDSQTFGLGVEQDRTFSARLEASLSSTEGPPIEVINAGVPGYGTFEELWKLERIVDRIDPDLVIVVCHVDNALIPDQGNDLWNNHLRIVEGRRAREETAGNPHDLPPPGADIPFLADHSHLYGLLSQVNQRLLGGGSFLDRVREYRVASSDSPELAEAWDTTRGLIREIGRKAEEASNARTMVLHLPGIPSVMNDDRSAVLELEGAGLPMASAFDALLAGLESSHRDLAFRHDSHYNDFAHDLIAKELRSFLSRQGFHRPNDGGRSDRRARRAGRPIAFLETGGEPCRLC